jgi:hypothetical protein
LGNSGKRCSKYGTSYDSPVSAEGTTLKGQEPLVNKFIFLFFRDSVLEKTESLSQNLIQEKIKRRMNSGNAYYHSVQNLPSSRLLLKNLKLRIYKTIILPVVLYECKTRSLTLREEHRLRVTENRVLRRIFGSDGRVEKTA